MTTTLPTCTCERIAYLTGNTAARCDLASRSDVADWCWPCFRERIAAVAEDPENTGWLTEHFDAESLAIVAEALVDVNRFGPWVEADAEERAEARRWVEEVVG